MPWQAGQQGSLSSEGRAHQLPLPSLGSSREVSGLAPQGVVVSALELAVSRSHTWSAATRSPAFWEALCWGQGQDGRTGSGWPAWLGQERELAWALAPRTHGQLVGHLPLCFVCPALSPALWTRPLRVICSHVRGHPRPRPRGVSPGDTGPNDTDCTPADPPLLTVPARTHQRQTPRRAGAGPRTRAVLPACLPGTRPPQGQARKGSDPEAHTADSAAAPRPGLAHAARPTPPQTAHQPCRPAWAQ